jgi:hypothetical protein
MSAQKLDKILARRQRGVRLRKDDAFFRSGRILRIIEAGSTEVKYEFADGAKRTQSRQDFLSRALSRIKIKRGRTPTNLEIAASISRSKSFPTRAKIDLLRGLIKKSSGAEKVEIAMVLNDLRSEQRG